MSYIDAIEGEATDAIRDESSTIRRMGKLALACVKYARASCDDLKIEDAICNAERYLSHARALRITRDGR